MSIQVCSRRALLALLLALAAVVPAAGTSYVMVSDEGLVAGAPLVVVGRVVDVDRGAMIPGPGGPALRTVFRVAVEEALKGTAPAQEIEVRVPGGVKPGGLALKIYGAPRFATGERALLFLEPDGRGGFRPLHLMLGAFHEVPAGARSLAVRDLREVSEVRVTAGGVAPAPARREPLRDFAAFTGWIRQRAAGVSAAADYQVADPDGVLRQITEKYTLFTDPGDGKNLRWFDFDSGGHVPWLALATGEQGLAGGGYSEFQTALQAWNNEPQTPVDYRYAGTTTSTNGLDDGHYDNLNTIVFNDPTDHLSAFSCISGGTLAEGGPWYDPGTSVSFQGRSYHQIVNADLVINKNLGCFFAASPDGSKAAQEIFAHELGHTLGLDHSCGDAESGHPSCTDPVLNDALMRAYIHDDGRGGRLGTDDQAGLRALYKLAGGSLPAAPTSLAGTATSTTVIHLTWHDNASNETEYRIEAKLLGGTFADIGGVAANSTAADVTALAPATGYAFRVRAHNSAGYSAYSNEVTVATSAPIAPCVADAQTLCLNGNRFQVKVAWTTPAGQTGAGSVVPVTSSDSGLLFFFDPANWEMLIKVLNGCGQGGHYWVFFAATTNVQFIVTVADTQTGATRVYFNPLNTSAAAVTDTGAFACP